MKRVLMLLKLLFESIRCLPHLILFHLHSNRKLIWKDTLRWLHCYHISHTKSIGFIYLLGFHPEFRNLFYKRVGIWGNILNLICPKMSTLFITTEVIGEGLFIQHGFATYIAAKAIGNNCWINQQVTIGYSSTLGLPVLLDNVVVNAGAKVIGNVTIGNNSKIGANAVVVKDVPDNCVVVGVPAYIVRRNGQRVNEIL